MNKLIPTVLTFFILFIGVGSPSFAAVNQNEDVDHIKAAITQFNPNANLGQIFASYSLFKEVTWLSIPNPNGKDSTVQVIGIYDLDKFSHLQYGDILPRSSVDKVTVDAFKSEFSEVQYIINFSLVHMGAGVAVKVNSTSFNMIKKGQNNFFPDVELNGFHDIALNLPSQFILRGLAEMVVIEKNSMKGENQFTAK
jgi:hypothetical protein